ncbi:MAG: oxidoreductase [Candidatus Eremiobacteraeota bacterium]|nr:oxidoreductase [Candidatus Eremiobacteraeota bacterium]
MLTAVLPGWMGVIDLSIANVGFGIVAGALNVSVDEVAWISTSYALAMMTSMLLCGWFTARVGRTNAFLLMIAIFTVGSLFCALSTSLTMLVVMRFAQGFGAGAMQTLGTASVLEAYPSEQHPKALKIYGAVTMIGLLLGPTLGGWILANFPWQFAFLINVPIGAAALAMGIAFLPEHGGSRRQPSFDWASLGMMFGGLTAFLYALQEGPRQQWFSSGVIVGALALSLVLLWGFVHVQLRSKSPLVDLRFLRIRSYSVGVALAVVIGVGLTGTGFLIPLYCEEVLGFDAQAAGMTMLVGALMSMAGLEISGVLQKRTSPYVIFALALGCLAGGTFWFAFLGKDVGFDQTIAPRVMQGIGMGMFTLPFSLIIVRDIPRGHYDRSQGLVSVSQLFGISLGYAVLSALLVRMKTVSAIEFFRGVKTIDLTPSMGLAPIRDWLLAHGSSAARADHDALPLFQRMASHTAVSLGYSRTFFVLGTIFAVCIPCILLLMKTEQRSPSP